MIPRRSPYRKVEKYTTLSHLFVFFTINEYLPNSFTFHSSHTLKLPEVKERRRKRQVRVKNTDLTARQ